MYIAKNACNKGAVGLGDSYFNTDSYVPSAGISLVRCYGNERRLDDCPAVRVFDDSCEKASAVCQGRLKLCTVHVEDAYYFLL